MTAVENRSTSARVSSLTSSIEEKLSQSLSAISAVNTDLRLLAFNAKIQAAKAGDAGAGFGVVANEIKDLVGKTQSITDDLSSKVGHTIHELVELNELLETQVRGRRLAQVAANCIDLVDRNLYERSCDVRWWATEGALIQALTTGDAESLETASMRMATILDSYTVYFDLVLCDLDGNVLCNGRPGRYRNKGRSVLGSGWFERALQSADGTQFATSGPACMELVSGEPALIYSCGVRAGGNSNGRLLGVLGIVFNWDGLGDQIVLQAEQMLSSESLHEVAVYLCSEDGKVLSAQDRSLVGKPVQLPDPRNLWNSKERFCLQKAVGQCKLTAYAPSAGYETYRTGWMALVVEKRCV